MLSDKNDPCHRLMRASHSLKRRINSRLSVFGLTFSQYHIISCLYENEKDPSAKLLSPAELAELTDCERPTTTGVIDRLEKQGFVAREPNLNDRRSQNIVLTNKTEELVDDMAQIFIDIRNQALEGFSQEEIENFQDYLLRVIYNLNK